MKALLVIFSFAAIFAFSLGQPDELRDFCKLPDSLQTGIVDCITSNLDEESVVLLSQMEACVGRDFIDIVKAICGGDYEGLEDKWNDCNTKVGLDEKELELDEAAAMTCVRGLVQKRRK